MKILAAIYLSCFTFALLNIPLLFKSKNEEWVASLSKHQSALLVFWSVIMIVISGLCMITCPALAILVLLS